jgi:hypothetical protein
LERQLGERRVGALGLGSERFKDRGHRRPRDGAEDLFLGVKIEVDGRF